MERKNKNYLAVDKKTGLWYFGWTSLSLEERIKNHYYDVKNIGKERNKNRPFIEILSKRKKEEISWFIIDTNDIPDTPYHAKKMEIELIERCNTFENGLNATRGGDGTVGRTFKHSEETKRKISLANKGQKRTEKQRKEMSERLKGRKLSSKHKENVVKAIRKRYQDPNYRKRHKEFIIPKSIANNKKVKKVMLIDMWRIFSNTNFAAEWIRENTEWKSANYKSIWRASSGKRKKAYGYKWKFID